MLFKTLKTHGWRQFKNIDIEFHPRLTILTGTNGAGKSTILKILSSSFGQSESLLSTPVMNKKVGIEYYSGILRRRRLILKDSQNNNFDDVGSLSFDDEQKFSLKVPKSTGVSYNIILMQETNNYLQQMNAVSGLQGLYIRSHRPISVYQQVSNIPTNIITAETAFSFYQQAVSGFMSGGYGQFSPTYRIKEAIISMATFGPGNSEVQGNSTINEIYMNFKEVLRNILPDEIGFLDLNIRIPDVVLVTKSGEFMLDASSGGLMSLIDLAWQIFLMSINKESFVVLLDEPENHLHPSMQRTVMNSLLNAFPQVQFIVATHSPFVVTSVKDSSVFVLKHSLDKDSKMNEVTSAYLDSADKSGTASETLRDVLGVPVTMPLWAEKELVKTVEDISVLDISEETLNTLRRKLSENGLENYFPEALNIIFGGAK